MQLLIDIHTGFNQRGKPVLHEISAFIPNFTWAQRITGSYMNSFLNFTGMLPKILNYMSRFNWNHLAFVGHLSMPYQIRL